MPLITYKLLTALVIAAITLSVGLFSLRFIRNQKQLLQIGDAAADGIFLGVALFHLFPNALTVFHDLWRPSIAYPITLIGMLGGFSLLLCLERTIIHQETHQETYQETHPEQNSESEMAAFCRASIWMLIGILSVHAFIEGVALGISDQSNTIMVLFIAILAHKGFETYALVMGLYRANPEKQRIKPTIGIFSLVTPAGILAASFLVHFLQTDIAHIITGIFSAIAAGSFLYIGTLHSTHMHFHPARDDQNRWPSILATIMGFAAMGIIAIWV